VKHGQFTMQSTGTIGTTIGQSPMPACVFDGPISAEDWSAIQNRHKFIVFNGFIRYEDAFHKYKWHFGAIYVVDGKYFTTAALPPAYNQDIQEDQQK
jgi:hypothetical protein